MHSSRMRTARSSSHLPVWGGGLPQCMLVYPLGVGLETPLGVSLETPLGVGLETPSRPDPSISPLGVGLETPQARPLNIPPGYGPGDPPVDRQTCVKHNLRGR